MTNRLAAERSPYLLQHADNPVDWYPWGREAFERARREDKPILVSIGYSACHWCHVMERESFEDDTTARLMNDRFVNVKVDREERPDVDAIYMEAVQLLTRQGGWPLNVFLTPDGKPFYGGTYFPPRPAHGMPSWPQILEMVSTAYRESRDDVAHNASTLTDYIQQSQQIGRSEETIGPEILRDAYSEVTRQLDWGAGGFGSAPKFPQPLALEVVLRLSRRFEDERGREFVELTLRKMAAGGIFDQLGGGFHRYTVDGLWVVPHFEKMLYDNALLARVYLQAFQFTHHPFYRTIVERTLDYLLRDMRSSEGGFFSAEDADSEGVEGKYYVWTPEDLARSLTADEAEIVSLRYGVGTRGNFEGKTILTLQMPIAEIAERTGARPEEIEASLHTASQKLLDVRYGRVPPGKDTKILCSWNALAIRALAEAGRVLERDDYLQAARRAAAFLMEGLRPGGRLVRSYREGPSDIPGFLEDYAYLAEALLTLYQTTFDSAYLEQAQQVLTEMIERFWDDDQRAFFDVAADTQDLIVRPRNLYDNPIPSGTSAATFALLRFQALTGDPGFEPHILSAFHAARDLLVRAPLGFSALLSALDFYLSPQIQVAILGDSEENETRRLIRAVFDRYLPNAVVAVGDAGGAPLLEGRNQLDGRPTAFVCEHFACKLPVTTAEELAAQLEELGS